MKTHTLRKFKNRIGALESGVNKPEHQRAYKKWRSIQSGWFKQCNFYDND